MNHDRNHKRKKDSGREAYSIPEWCASVGISCALFYKLPPDELPAVTKLGRRSLITRRASDEWQARAVARVGS